MSLAVALLAEHLTTGTPLEELVGRLGVVDKTSLASSCVEAEAAAMRLRDLAAPRRNGSDDGPVGGQKRETPDGHRMANRFRGRCECGRYVPAGHGWAVKVSGKWAVKCRSCEG